jgi:hypothetical protein
MKVVRSSPLGTGRLYPQEFSWYSFLEAESTPRHMVPSVADLCCTPGIYTVEHPEDGHTSDLTMYVLRTKDIYNNLQVCICWFKHETK